MRELKSILLTFSQSDLCGFYQKGLAASKEAGKPDFYLDLLQGVIKDVCGMRGFDYDEVIKNVDPDATA